MDIFTKAAKKKVRFETELGELNTEQLFDLPLVKLDVIARKVNSNLKEFEEESFIEMKPHPEKATCELKLDIIKEVISIKQNEQQEQKKRFDRAEKRKKIIEALAEKDDEALSKKSRSALLKDLEALDE